MERSLHAPETPFTRWLVRWRGWFFAGLVLMLLVQFNGQWRIGLDSSIYRGVGESLAEGRGYSFAGRRQNQVYPGLPVLLATSQKLFGTKSVVPPAAAHERPGAAHPGWGVRAHQAALPPFGWRWR